jgi:hypothetical protein
MSTLPSVLQAPGCRDRASLILVAHTAWAPYSAYKQLVEWLRQ